MSTEKSSIKRNFITKTITDGSQIPYCVDHSKCIATAVRTNQKMVLDPDEIAYIGICVGDNICFLKFCEMDMNNFVVEDLIGNKYTYNRVNIIGYLPLPKKLPDNDKKSTVLLRNKSETQDEIKDDMKCFYCNSTDVYDYLIYYDGVHKCTTVCNNICGTYFERNNSNINCVECGGSGLFKQKWACFQNKDTKKMIRYRYCQGSTECLDNITANFKAIIKSELTYACEECGKSSVEHKLKTCGGCLKVKYCGVECQVSNWGKHKHVCKILKQG